MSDAIEKPLFIPLAAQWFDAFAAGKKTIEYRRPGGPWNPRNCRIGRRVTLSRGYGKHARLSGTLIDFRIVPISAAPEAKTIYPRAKRLAALHIKLDAQ